MKRYLFDGARWLIGLFVLSSGVLYFLGLEKLPPLGVPMAQTLFDALKVTGLLTLVKVLEVGFGLSMISNRFVPLALVMFFPITVFIGYFDFFLLRGENYGFVTAGPMVLIHVALLCGYLPLYTPMMGRRNQPDLDFTVLTGADAKPSRS